MVWKKVPTWIFKSADIKIWIHYEYQSLDCVLRSINQWVSKSNIMVIAFDKVPKYDFMFTFIVRAFVDTVFATHHVSSIF
jgi:hypothetical protein